ncbi:uncharacterized protein LOC126576556 [Anopheles aquasalis]|uniref:uncharacterized protein LOC126576556 n=1 Tax=Anopheles aquasalis TaxID=42839 RepID=UPI00215A24BF|nr:uncharacterized protein LOC126576556 [Anopheles aquasalis]
MDKKSHNLYMEPERSLYLISLVEQNSCLWDRRNALYRNTYHLADVWERIAEEIGESSNFCIRKRKSLQASYRTNKQKYHKTMVTGSAASSVAKPAWYASAMSFLRDTFDAGSSTDTVYQPQELQQPKSTTTSTSKVPTQDQQELFRPIAGLSQRKYKPPITTTTLQVSFLPSPSAASAAAMAAPPAPAPPTPPRIRAQNLKRRWNELNLTYNEEAMKTVSGLKQLQEQLCGALFKLETEGSKFGTMAAKKLDSYSPLRRKKLILQFEKQLEAEDGNRLFEKHGIRLD